MHADIIQEYNLTHTN